MAEETFLLISSTCLDQESCASMVRPRDKLLSRGFFLESDFGKQRFLSYVSNFYAEESRLHLSQTNSTHCLICAEFLETSDRVAVFGRSQCDLRGTLCKILGGELQTSIEDLQYVCKRKCYPTLTKMEKMMSNVKSLEEELRAEMSKNAVVRIKRGLSRDQTQEGSLEATPVKKALFPTNPPQDQTRFPSPVTAREGLTELPSTISMVGYAAVRHSGVPVVVRAFPACVNIGKNFFSPASQHSTSQQLPPDKLGAANRETVSKSNLDGEPFVQVWTISILKPLFTFSKFNNTPVIFDHGLFCSKRNNKKVHFCFT